MRSFRWAPWLWASVVAAGLGGGAARADVIITELMAGNSGTLLDEDGDPSDWIELYNDGNSIADLEGWYLTDDPDVLQKWRFPAVTVEAGGFLVVFASGKNRTASRSELHANFRLATRGEYLALLRPDGVTAADEFVFPPQRQDVSWGVRMEADVRTLVATGATARVRIPPNGADGAEWTGAREPFDDFAWNDGDGSKTGVGYTDEEVVAIDDGLAEGLVAAWTFETSDGAPVRDGLDASGRRVDEVSGHPAGPFHGTASAGVYRADTPENVAGSSFSLEFEESGTVESFRVDMATPIARLTTGDFTLHTWFKSTDSGRSILMGSCCATLPGALNFELHTSNRLRVWIAGPTATTDLNVSVNSVGNSRDNRWHSAVALRRGSTVELYFDGVRVGSTSDVAGEFEQAPATYYFGRDDREGDTRFDGKLDNIAFWNRALDADEIRSLADGADLGAAAGFAGLIGTDVEQPMKGKNPSAYIRIGFDVDDPEALQSMLLRMKYDDGFVAYLNGWEVARRNAPAEVLWNSTATEERAFAAAVAFEDIRVAAPSALLVAGRNILAIHGLNSSAGDEDFLILPELTALTGSIDLDDLRYFSKPTPGATNEGGFLGFVEETEFSVTRGFFEDPFSLELSNSTPDSIIKYSDDGSWPDADTGKIYTGPIPITTTTAIRATAFIEGYLPEYTAHTYIFLEDVIRQPASPEGFPGTWQPGWTADYAMDQGVVNDPLYRNRIVNDLKSIPTMSIVMDVDDIFGQPDGIYSNSEARGIRWERIASTEFFDPGDPDREFHINSAIRSHGGATRVPSSSIKHSFRLIFKDTYGADDRPTFGPTKLRFALFPDSPVDRFDTLVLRAGYNYSYLHGSAAQNLRAQYIRERWMRETQLDTGHLSSHGTYVHLYLNGLYWGIFAPQERPDASFMAEHLGGDKEEYDSLNANVPTGGDWIRRDGWDALVRKAGADLSNTENYEAVLEDLDLENLIDYMIVHVYGGTTDWPVGPGGKNYWQGRWRGDGRWQFFIWDGEYSLQGVNDNRVGVSDANTPAYLYSQLRSNEEYRVLFGDHVHRHFFNNGALAPRQCIARYMELADFIESSMVGESARWGDRRRPGRAYTLREWINERDWMTNTYMPRRTAVVLEQFRGVRLYPRVEAPSFNQHGGAIPDGFRLEILPPAAGETYYTLDGTDPRLPGGDISANAIKSTEASGSFTLLETGADVRFHVPEDGSLALDWTELDFNDAGWLDGKTGIGFERSFGYEDLIATDVEATMFNVNATIYLRIAFDVDDPSGLEFLNLRMKYDDGYVAYLNGERVAARNAPASPTWNSEATASHFDSEAIVFEDFDVTAEIGLLRPGRNVLAVHGLNSSSFSGDFLIIPEIEASESRRGINIERTTRARSRALVGGDWSALNEAVFVVDSSALRITEIMYHPPEAADGSEFTNRDDFEFLELQNTGARPLNLMGIRFTSGIEFTFPERPPGDDLGPAEYVLLVKNLDAFASRYDTAGLSIAGEYRGRLANGGEEIVVEDSLGRTLLRFEYDDGWVPETDGLGHSLQIVDPTADPKTWGERASWRASRVAGGTPGLPDEEREGSRFVRGDSNGDGRLDVADATYTLEYLFRRGATPPCKEAVDANADQRLDISDPVRSLLYLFAGGAEPEAPFPECGTSSRPGEPSLGCQDDTGCRA